jgi:hypothetical protein
MMPLVRIKVVELLKDGKTPDEITLQYIKDGYSRAAVVQLIKAVINPKPRQSRYRR